jgi:hypothetical protein
VTDLASRLVVVCNPGSEREAALARAAAAAGLAPPLVVPWLGLLRGEVSLEACLTSGSVLRLESPGEEPRVERELLALGAEVEDREQPDAARLPAAAARALPDDPGRLLHPRQWFLGLRAALEGVARTIARAPGCVVTTPPADVALLFDKPRCHARLAAAGVPVPVALLGEGRGAVRGWSELRRRMAEARTPRVFVKLACGSSASGIVALELRGERVAARTTVSLTEVAGGAPVLHNVARPRRETDPGRVAAIVDALCREGAHVEAWVPKAGLAGRPFDLRVVVIAGRPRHVVVRTSPGPITNLHLGGQNRRGDPEAARARVGEAAWGRALDAAAAAAACFPGSLQVGVDVAIHAGGERVAVLEVNAFGDLLRRALHEGQDPHAAELAALQAGWTGAPLLVGA